MYTSSSLCVNKRQDVRCVYPLVSLFLPCIETSQVWVLWSWQVCALCTVVFGAFGPDEKKRCNELCVLERAFEAPWRTLVGRSWRSSSRRTRPPSWSCSMHSHAWYSLPVGRRARTSHTVWQCLSPSCHAARMHRKLLAHTVPSKWTLFTHGFRWAVPWNHSTEATFTGRAEMSKKFD